jgi:hypothetical protein
VLEARPAQRNRRNGGEGPGIGAHDADCIDYLIFVHDRHDGNRQAARRYLAWETQLVSQLGESELSSYRLARDLG